MAFKAAAAVTCTAQCKRIYGNILEYTGIIVLNKVYGMLTGSPYKMI